MSSPTTAQKYFPVASVGDIAARASRRVPKLIFDFIDGAAGTERAAHLNQGDLAGINLMPRVLAGASADDLSVHFLGRCWALPFGIAPMGMCNLAWPGTDQMMANSARESNIPLGVSTASSTDLEAMLASTEGGAWFQLYVTGTAERAFALVDRAATAGYEILILTVDVPKVANRPRDQRNGFETPFRLRGRHCLDFAMHPRWSISTILAGTPQMVNFIAEGQARGFDRNAPRTATNWEFLARLRERWKGKLIVKGVLNADDAVRIKDSGADSIYVSNHGGRQLDSAPSAISALPAIRQTVGPDYPLVFDSGVRSGEDILKALACGANFVMLGRPFLYAAAAAGQPGVAGLIQYLRTGLDIALAQVGLGRSDAVTENVITRRTDGTSSAPHVVR
jgi:L-lactate dehydrogenase (cytochrome)